MFCLTLNPSRYASPEVIISSPVSILKVLVLPAPFTPSKPKHSPCGMPTLRLKHTSVKVNLLLDVALAVKTILCKLLASLYGKNTLPADEKYNCKGRLIGGQL